MRGAFETLSFQDDDKLLAANTVQTVGDSNSQIDDFGYSFKYLIADSVSIAPSPENGSFPVTIS